MKGLQVAAAAACRAGQASTLFDHDLQRLLHALATTMVANPLQAVRNAAHYATDAVLDALTVSPHSPEHLMLLALAWQQPCYKCQVETPPSDSPNA